MNLEPLHDKLNREHPRFSAHLAFAERDAIVRTIIRSIGDVDPDAPPVPESPSPDEFDAQVTRFHASGCAAELEGLKPSDPDFWRRVLRGVRGESPSPVPEQMPE